MAAAKKCQRAEHKYVVIDYDTREFYHFTTKEDLIRHFEDLISEAGIPSAEVQELLSNDFLVLNRDFGEVYMKYHDKPVVVAQDPMEPQTVVLKGTRKK